MNISRILTSIGLLGFGMAALVVGQGVTATTHYAGTTDGTRLAVDVHLPANRSGAKLPDFPDNPFSAKVHRAGDTLQVTYPNGVMFTLRRVERSPVPWAE